MERKLFIAVGIVCILIVTSVVSGMRIHNESLNKIIKNNDKSVKVVVGPMNRGKIDLDRCEQIKEMTEEEAESLKKELLDVDTISGLSTLESLEKKMEILRKYEIFSPSFTIENLTKVLEDMSLNKESSNGEMPTNSPSVPTIIFDKTYTNWGPHIFLYLSFGTAATTFPIPPYGIIWDDKSDLQDLFPFLGNYDVLDNFSVFTYTFFATAEFMFGGSLGNYYSIGIFPSLESSTFHFSGPFFGLYVFLANVGIYIYNEKNVETPYLDIYLGVSPLFSFQQLILPDEKYP
jgi:hypothetical protein